MKEHFVTDAKGNRIAVLLPIKHYNRILQKLEDLEDIKAYDKAMSLRQEVIPLNQAFKEIETARKKKAIARRKK